ncbi:MAG: 4-alpha-glucanotransferase [Clostridia bacterium]|nr:4-alpha-glucanotransferase [Clostridia bacterium]
MKKRQAGILLHISSLPSRYGIGTLGEGAYRFADFLCASGCSIWQVLPIGPTGFGDSPYQSFSSFAGNLYFIDPDMLKGWGLLTDGECGTLVSPCDGSRVDYGELYRQRRSVLSLAAERFPVSNGEYESFCCENAYWLESYALFEALKSDSPQRLWQDWEDGIKYRKADALDSAREKHAKRIRETKVLQFLFRVQWDMLRKYCRERGISVMGDIPIYVAEDSADIWSTPGDFLLDSELRPTVVAGCPPDSFSENGQLWGNPIYNWSRIMAEGGGIWKHRLKSALSYFDMIRIDHFRGIDSFYCIPAGSPTAVDGHWEKGPGKEFIDFIRREFGDIRLIAEDLGFITESVRDLLSYSGYPGMKVLEFGFYPGAEEYLPHNYPVNCVAYTGTHDNDTMLGHIASLSPEERSFALDYLGASDNAEAARRAMTSVLSSVAKYAVVPMQDVLLLGGEGRMNTPGTTGGDNWRWRMKDIPSHEVSGYLRRLCTVYGRI